MEQADGGHNPMSPATRKCKHRKLKKADVVFGPVPFTWMWLPVSGWQCEACGSGFASKRAITLAEKKAGVSLG